MLWKRGAPRLDGAKLVATQVYWVATVSMADKLVVWDG